MLATGQFTVYATFLAYEGKYEQMKELCHQSLTLTKAATGAKHALCLEPPKPEKPFVFVSVWQSKGDFQAFLQSPPMQEFHNKAAVQQMFDTALQKATADFYTVLESWTTSGGF